VGNSKFRKEPVAGSSQVNQLFTIFVSHFAKCYEGHVWFPTTLKLRGTRAFGSYTHTLAFSFQKNGKQSVLGI